MMKNKSTAWRTITLLSWMTFFINLFFLSPVTVFFYQQRGLDYFEILALESILSFCIFIFEVPTGILADKLGRKKTIMLGTLFFLIHSIIFLYSQNFLLFALAFCLSGVALALHSGTIEAIIYDQLNVEGHSDDMKKAMGQINSSSTFAMVLAPIVGSLLAKDLQMQQFMILLVMTVGAMTIGFILTLFIKDTHTKKIEENNPFIIIREGFQIIAKNKSLIKILLLSVLSSPFLVILNYLYQPFLKNANVEVSLFGTLFALSFLLSALSSRYAHKLEKTLGMKRTVFWITLAPGIIYLLMSFVNNPFIAIILFLLIMAIGGLRGPLFSAYKNDHIPSHVRATVLSLISLAGSLYAVVMRLVIGEFANWGLNYAFILMGVLVVFAALFLSINESHIGLNNHKA